MSNYEEINAGRGKVYVAVDCGFTGYISVIGEDGRYISHYKTPTLSESKSVKKRATGKVVTKTKTWLDLRHMCEILTLIRDRYDVQIVVVEKQHPMTGQGLASTGKTMEGYGVWKGMLTGLGMPMYLASAVEWQKVTSDPKAEDKKLASIHSVKNWDKEIDLRKTKRSKIDDHNLADALNIGRFAWHKFGHKGEITNG